MGAFFNKRIEAPFEGAYKGFNQYIYTGCIDDLFLMDSDGDGMNLNLCRVSEALVEYGKKKNYDLVITVKEDLTFDFATPEQKELFDSLSRGSSARLVESGHKTNKFQPRQRGEKANAERTPASSEAKNAESQNIANAVQNVKAQAAQNDGMNRLSQITRILTNNKYKTLVIFPYPEKMIAGGSVDGSTLQRMEVLVKDWRDIAFSNPHPETRSVLIINPHRLKEFHLIERTLSCFDHNCKEIEIELPPKDEMSAWAFKYRCENNIQGTSHDMERVVLTGRDNIKNGNLQNFVSWVQGFYRDKTGIRKWTDLLSEENQEAVESKEMLLNRLDEMIGLDEVKTKIHEIVHDVETNHETAQNATYHMFFLGNPGTGKTVVAGIVAKLFWAMELRTQKTVVNIAIQDVISQYNEGETIQKMKDKVKEAMGGVLFIDEAYLFAESEWGRKAFQVLLTEMENNRNNLTVIFAGYEDRLQSLKDVNPGFDSRIKYRLHFNDYNKEEKLEIFKLYLRNETKNRAVPPRIDEAAEKKLLRILDNCEGNGRGVRNVFDDTMKFSNGADVILESHVKDPHEIHPEEAAQVLEDIEKNFIGMAGLKKRLQQYFNRIKWNVERNKTLGITKPTDCVYRIRFTGPPGTGKTSIARYMGRFFHAMGICETSECRECGATSLKGAYVGHAQNAVNNLFHENRGKVIFIDEIYSLYNPDAHQDDTFSREVIDTMVRCLTAEEYQRTVVIVAGYKDRVDKFMEANPGLASRIPDEILFDDYSAEDCVQIFKACAKKRQYVVLPECDEKLKAYFENEKKDVHFGNARTVNNTFGIVENNIIERLSSVETKTEEQFTLITQADIPEPRENIEAKANANDLER